MQSPQSSTYHNHLCPAPMAIPKKEYEMLKNEEKECVTINSKFALKTLHDMWKSGKIYWNLGANLLMINPKRNTTTNNTKCIIKDPLILPFITNIMDNITHSQQNQSIIALGTVGSGKTNTTEQIVSHLVTQSSNNAVSLVNLWKNISLIYKIFGSHGQGHNVNSSGCAKICKLIYESDGRLQGILCESLLWHKFIPSLNNNTTNGGDVISGYFHIFSMVINHPNYLHNPLTNKIKQNDIFLSYPSLFSDENELMIAYKQCLNDLMIPLTAQKEMFDIIYSVLCLNQIEFICNNDSSHSISVTISKASLPFAKQICYLLQYEAKDLLQYLMTQTINAQNKSFARPHVSVTGAYKKVQRLCCILYECIIGWLFDHIDTLCLNSIDSERVTHFISIVDFPGFSNKQNSNLDVFCTNFCNENLQQLFNSLILQSNQELYVDDGLNWIATPIADYSKVIDLIASPPNGIFHILNKYNNETEILHKIAECHPFKRQLITISNKNTSFTIHHYHSTVEYDIKHFVFSNNCNVFGNKNDDILPLLNKSNLNILKYFMEKDKNTKNRVNKIHFQIRNLIKVIKTTNISNILCINPSQNSTDSHFSRDYVLAQIKSLSVVETLRDSINGYAAYIESEKLLNIYNNYITNEMNNIHKLLSALTAEQKCAAVLILFGIHTNCYKFGLTKVFIKHSALKKLRKLQSFDAPQLNPLQKNILITYIQTIKMQKLTGLSKTYCRLNHRLQHFRVFDAIKNVLFLQKFIGKAFELKQKHIGSIPIFQKHQKHAQNNNKNTLNFVNDKKNMDINVHLNNLFNNCCYYNKINENVSIYINPYSLSNLESNKYNKEFLRNMLNKIQSDMIKNKEPQSLILHGNNSSGKTTNFFFISNHFVLNEDKRLSDILWAANQILISFCHCSSVQNVNSSQYIAVRKFSLNNHGKLNGIQQNVKLLSPFLCELDSNGNSRNFHLFYSICKVLKNDERFLLENPFAFSCLNSNVNNNDFEMSDNDQFVYFVRALKILNVSTSKQQQICRLCAAILHLCNLKAEWNECDGIAFDFCDRDKKYLFAASYLLRVQMENLCDILLPKSCQYFHETVNSQNKSQITMQILHKRDILNKSLYELLFEYINNIINDNFDEYFIVNNTEIKENANKTEFLLVDMSGRNNENINNNRFRNLAANYSFDIIQNNINKQYIIETQNRFIDEIENYKFINVNDYKQQYNINEIISVFDYIQTHKYHKTDSNKIFKHMMENTKNNNFVETDDFKFTVNHCPDNISYNTQFVFDDSQYFEFDSLIKLLSNSSLSIAHKLTNFYAKHKLFDFQQGFGSNRINSVISECFDYLFDKNNNINNNYLLCIRPNCNQNPNEWNTTIIQQQLKSFHIPKIINIQKNQMPLTMELSATANKLCHIFGDNEHVIELNEYNQPLLIILLFGVFDIKPSQYKIGKTLLFICDEYVNNKVDKLLNFNSPLPPIQNQQFEQNYIKTKTNRIKNVLSMYTKLSNGCNKICYKTGKKHQRNAIETVINYTRFLSPIIKITKAKLEKERIEKEKEIERLKQQKWRELRKLEIEQKKLEKEYEIQKQKKQKDLENLEKQWRLKQNETLSELAKIERELKETGNDIKIPPLHIIGSSKLDNVCIQQTSKNNKNKNMLKEPLDLNAIIHNVMHENERKQSKQILKELYKYKMDKSMNINPHNIFIKIRALIKNAKPMIRYDLYKGFEELILNKHLKMYHILLKEVKSYGYNLKQIMKGIREKDIDCKITEKERERMLEISDMLHSHKLLDRNIIFQYLYELDDFLKILPHKDYIDMVALIEIIVNEHNLPMFVHIFQPLRAQKEFLTKMSLHFSQAMYKIFKILLDQMIDNMESDNHNTNLDSIFRDLAKIFVKLPKHVNMDAILSEFLLYFVPSQYANQFHQSTRHILSKRYQEMPIKVSPKNNNTKKPEKAKPENKSKPQSEEDLRETTCRNQQNLKQTVFDELQSQAKQSQRMEDKIDHLKQHKPPIAPNEQNKNIKKKESDDIHDPYIYFITDCFNKFDPNQTDKIPLHRIPKLLDLLDITGNKRQTLIDAFNDMCKITDPEIYRHQYLSALIHTKGKQYENAPAASPTIILSPPQPPPQPLSPTVILAPPFPPSPPSSSNMRNKVFTGHAKIMSLAKTAAVKVLPQSTPETDFKNKKQTTPTIAKLLSDKDCIHAWTMKKGDTFFKTNKKRFIILSDHIFYWCSSDTAKYPNGGLNLHSSHVHVSRHGTTLRIKSSDKERIFNCGDIHTATKMYDKMIQQQKNKPIPIVDNVSVDLSVDEL